MERYQGKLICRPNRVGTHSEGNYAFLVPDEGPEIPLCRTEAAPFNDPLFESFDGQHVRITGRISHGWLIAEQVEPAPTEDGQAEHTATEPVMQSEQRAGTNQDNDNTESL